MAKGKSPYGRRVPGKAVRRLNAQLREERLIREAIADAKLREELLAALEQNRKTKKPVTVDLSDPDISEERARAILAQLTRRTTE